MFLMITLEELQKVLLDILDVTQATMPLTS